MITIAEIRRMSADECMQGIRATLLRSGVRTADGFECVGEYASYNVLYSILLPYEMTAEDPSDAIIYRKMSHTEYEPLATCSLAFIRAMYVVVRRESFSRYYGMGIGEKIEPSCVQILEYLAAGHSQADIMNAMGLSRREIRTKIAKLLATWKCTSMSVMVAKYLLHQMMRTHKQLIVNPYLQEEVTE
jgi:DNA-binding CsgD family transcriptional regulator